MALRKTRGPCRRSQHGRNDRAVFPMCLLCSLLDAEESAAPGTPSHMNLHGLEVPVQRAYLRTYCHYRLGQLLHRK